MLVLDAKRGIEATLERVFVASGKKIFAVQFRWTGTTASINYNETSDGLHAVVQFPELDEREVMSKSRFNDYIAYALHELGHAWFTENKPWDDAVRNHGQTLGKLINGLEDPRIEQCVIDSGYAPNSKGLFESLMQNLLAKNGYVDKVTYGNFAFVLCVEGRRLNGYHVPYPNPIPSCQFAVEMTEALRLAQSATSTAEIVKIAESLYKLFPEHQPEQPDDEGDDEGEGEGEGEGDKPTDNPTDKPTDKPSEDGEEGEPTDNPNDKPDDLPPLEIMEEGDDVDVEPVLEEEGGSTNRSAYRNRPNLGSVQIIKRG